jgi:gliding motility-associated-like protein
MRFKLLRFFSALGLLFLLSGTLSAQSCIPTGINNTVITSSCSQMCRDIVLQIPDLRTSSLYQIVNIPYNPYPYVTIGGTEDFKLYNDDNYSNVFSLPFPFCFYDNVYTQAVVSSNGLVTFDPAYANCGPGGAAWNIVSTIPYNGGGGDCGTSHYPRASIMAAFMDLDPRPGPSDPTVSSPADRKIEWRVEGSAPCRKFIVSYYHIGVYQATTCGLTTPATFQIVMYESTGLIDIFFENKNCIANGGNGARSILGVQDATRMKALAAIGKNATTWSAFNEGYRFVPFGGASRFVSSELLALNLTHIAWATSTSPTAGLIDINFPNICSPAPTTQYIVRTTYSTCDNPAVQLVNMDTVTVNQNTNLNATATTTSTNCGPPSGTITVNIPAGSTSPFTYVLDGGAPIVDPAFSHTFNNLAQGPHTVIVTDGNGVCTSTINVTINIVNILTETHTSTGTTCPTANNGSITITSASGTPPYTFVLDGGLPQTGPLPYPISNVPAGSHTVTVTDVAGCTTSFTVNISAGNGPDGTANSTSTTCSGASNGTITVTPTAGAPPFTFQLDGGTAQPGNTFNGVAAGSHTVTIIDNAGCTKNIPVNVSTGPGLVTTVSKTDVLCNGGATGTIIITQPAIGTPPFEYSLDGVTWQPANTFTGLTPGAYTAYFRESNGCQGSQGITINEPTALTSSGATIAAICNGQNNGTITITVNGGISPYQYSIDGGVIWQGGNVFNVPAGNYTITIRDANNCTKTQNVTVSQPPLLTASSINSNATCAGGNNGTIVITAGGGNGSYTYSIDGINFQAANNFNVIPGNYTVTVKDNLGCSTSFPAVINLTNNLTLTPQPNVTICEGNSTQLSLVSNATIYAWTPATGLSNTGIANPVANPVATTQYIVTATLGLCSANDTVVVNVNTAPIPDAGPQGFICYGQSYQLQGAGGTNFSWTPPVTLNNPNISNPVATPGTTTTYTLSVVDANGCPSLVTDDVIVDVTPPIQVITLPIDTIGYPGDNFQLQAISGGNIYNWTPVIGLSDPNIPNPVVTVGAIGNDVVYKVTASTVAGCKGEGFITIRVYKGPDIYVPTAFTPNNDGLNDKFFPFPVGIKKINYFKVYNRWGQLMFSTTRLYDGWDGKAGGIAQGTGVYVWMAQGITKDDKVITKKGTVTLIR